MNLNVTFDTSVSSAPTGFVSAVNYVVNLFDTLFTANVTINIGVGYGEVNGTPLSGTFIGQSSYVFGPPQTYSTARNLLISHGDAGAGTLPTTDPTGGELLRMSRAEEKALGLLSPSTSMDGWVGFSTTQAFSYTPGVTPGSGVVYFVR